MLLSTVSHDIVLLCTGGRRLVEGRNVRLEDILRFTTGVEYEPVIGFTMPPTVSFLAHQHGVVTANTCTNTLYLPIPLSLSDPLPNNDDLFRMFDICFTDEFFGNI